MYVIVARENGAPLDVDIEADGPQRFKCSNANVIAASADPAFFIRTQCACCDRNLIIMGYGYAPTDADVAWLKGGRPH